MKKFHAAILVFLFLFNLSWAQVSTNVAGSKYQFKKVVLHDNTPVESQGKTSTCWSFSALSFFESELLRMGKKNVVPLSEMFVVRYAYEMKAEKFVRMDGKINFGEGGAFHDIPLVIQKYGIVPQSAYTGITAAGLTGTAPSGKRGEGYNHKELYNQLNTYMSEVAMSLEEGKGLDMNYKENIQSMLDKYMGEVPEKFKANDGAHSPLSYAKDLGLNMNDYVSITSFTNHEPYKRCLLEIPDNWAWGESYNVPLSDLTAITQNALKSGYTIAWGADVSEKGFSFKNGIAVVPLNGVITVEGKDNKGFNDAGAERTSEVFLMPTEELVVTPEIRQKAYDYKETTDDHGMHIVGMFTDQNGKIYYYVKNSWGTDNYPQGYLYVSEPYFQYKTINLYLHKNAIPKEIRTKLGL
jgi:bleomycin hydrolase